MDGNRLEPLAGVGAALGTALAAMEDTRSRTLAAIDGLTDAAMDVAAPGYPNTIGATLYHIAAIEADWLYADLLEVDYPDWLDEWFPFDVREEDGKLSPAPGFTLNNHLGRLAEVRRHFLDEIGELDPREFTTQNSVADNPSTPQWIFHHLGQHEAEHRGQIQVVRTLLGV